MDGTITKILGVLLPILMGLGFRLVRVFSDRDGDVLRTFVMRFTVPVMVFFSMYKAERTDITAMPVATFTPALAENFEFDVDVGNTAIIVTTILAMITLPVVAYLVVTA